VSDCRQDGIGGERGAEVVAEGRGRTVENAISTMRKSAGTHTPHYLAAQGGRAGAGGRSSLIG